MTIALTPSTSTLPAMASGETVLEGAREIPLPLIVPSKTNRRTVRNPEKDAELTESIRMRGVQQPIVVRSIEASTVKAGEIIPKYEIVCGHRRYEMSLKAGKATIPAVVKKLSNADALEIQAIENFQREDLDPVDRGWVVRDMLEQYKKGMSPKDALKRAGERLNCKERTLYNVMMLAELIPEFQEMLRVGTITASHGYEIGPFSADAQKELLKEINQQMKWNGGAAPSVRKLKEILRQEMYWPLDGAPWKKDDAALLAGAGACSSCPKNTAVNSLLIPGEKKPVCTDRVCFKQKLHNHIVQIEKANQGSVRISTQWNYRNPPGAPPVYEERSYKEAKKDSCPHVVTGVIVDGEQAGHTRLVCITKKCTVHFQSWERGGGSDYGRSNPRVSPAAIKAKMRSNKLNLAVRTKLSETMRTGVKKLEHDDLKVAASVMFEGLQHNLKQPLIGAMGWKISNSFSTNTAVTRKIGEMEQSELASFIAMICCVYEVVPGVQDFYGRDKKNLGGFDKRHKIGLEKVRDQVTKEMRSKFAEIDARKKAKATPQTSAKKKKGKAA